MRPFTEGNAVANVLGTLVVVLEAQTEAFAKGMEQAKRISFTTAGDIISSLGGIEKVLSKLKFTNAEQWVKSGEIIGRGTTKRFYPNG